MRTSTLDRAAILRDACIVTGENLEAHPSLANEFVLVRSVLTKLLDRHVHLVTWPNGMSAIVAAEPGTKGWDDLLIKTYEACIGNAVAAVFGD